MTKHPLIIATVLAVGLTAQVFLPRSPAPDRAAPSPRLISVENVGTAGDPGDRPVSGAWTAIDAADEDVIYASAQYLALFRSVDRGLSWGDISPSPMIGEPGFVAPFALAGPDAPQTIYAGTTVLIRTLNGGVSWEYRHYLGGSPATALAVSPVDGATWNAFTDGLPEALICMDLETCDAARLLRVATLLREVRSAGDHVMTWNGTSDAGRPQPAGVYLCRIAADGRSRTVKMQLVR